MWTTRWSRWYLLGRLAKNEIVVGIEMLVYQYCSSSFISCLVVVVVSW